MVPPHHGSGEAQPRDPGQKLVPHDHVGGHQGTLLGREGPGLVQDGIGNRHLPHVMEEGRLVEGPQSLRGEAHVLPDLHGEPGHPRGVAVGVGVARFHEVHDGLEDFAVAVLEFSHRVAREERCEHFHEVVALRRLAQDAQENDP